MKTGIYFVHFGLKSVMVFEAELRERMNVDIDSIPNEIEICKFEMRLKNFSVSTLIL